MGSCYIRLMSTTKASLVTSKVLCRAMKAAIKTNDVELQMLLCDRAIEQPVVNKLLQDMLKGLK